MASGSDLVLYDAPGSPCARRVRISMIEKGLSWKTVIVDLSRLEQKKPAYLRLNPNGVVPTLVHGERVVYESNVITEYLDEVFPDVRLYPDDPWERAQVKLWQAFELSFAKDYRPLMYQRLLGPIVRLTRTLDEALAVARRSTTNPFDLEWERKVWSLTVLTPDEEEACAARLYERVDVLERALERSAYLVGDRFTQADLSVFPRLRMYPFVQLPVTAARHPRVAAWMKRLEQRPSFEKSLFEAERGMQRLGNTRIMPWLASRLKKERPTLVDRIGLGVARTVFRRVMSGRDDVASARRQTESRARAEFRGTYLAEGRRPAAVAIPVNAPLVLYASPLSPACRRVEILLRAQGLAWTSKPVDLARGEQKHPDFLRLNPNGEVPVLVHGERVLYDSALISEYLDATFAGSECPSFFPADALGRAQAKMWIAYDQGAHKEWKPLLYHRVIGSKPLSREEEGLLQHELGRRLERVEAALARSPYLVGDALTVADIAWFSRLEMYPRLGVEIETSRRPKIAAWMEKLRSMPAFARENGVATETQRHGA